MALRWELGHSHNLACLFRRVDRRHDDSVGAAVEHQFRDLGIMARQPNQQIHARAFDGQRQFVEHTHRGRCVFHIDAQPVESLAGQDLGNRRMADHDPAAECRLAGTQFLFRSAHRYSFFRG